MFSNFSTDEEFLSIFLFSSLPNSQRLTNKEFKVLHANLSHIFGYRRPIFQDQLSFASLTST